MPKYSLISLALLLPKPFLIYPSPLSMTLALTD
jgi:hypothetical protein